MRLRRRVITRLSIKPTKRLETGIWSPTSSLSRATMARSHGAKRHFNDFPGSSQGDESDGYLSVTCSSERGCPADQPGGSALWGKSYISSDLLTRLIHRRSKSWERPMIWRLRRCTVSDLRQLSEVVAKHIINAARNGGAQLQKLYAPQHWRQSREAKAQTRAKPNARSAEGAR